MALVRGLLKLANNRLVSCGIDCDVHPAVLNVRQLLPYFDACWQEQITNRGLERDDFSLASFPASAPLLGPPGAEAATVPEHLNERIEWVGPDKVMFSTDYPQWDFKDPRYTFKVPLREPVTSMIHRGSALGPYGLA